MENVKKNLRWYGAIAVVVLLFLTALAIGCQGPAGPAGSTGPAGPAGSAGPAGPPGAPEKPPAPVTPVVANAGEDQAIEPGAAVTLKAAAKINDNSSVKSYKWTQVSGIKTTISGADSDTLKVTLPDTAAYKAELMKHLKTLDRFTVQAINPHSLEATEVAIFKVTVTTSSGSYSDMVNVSAHLPYVWNGGIQNVPKGLAVLIHGKDQAAYAWELNAPSGSKAALDKISEQNPMFTPDAAGKYTLTEKNSGTTLNVYAGTWAGAISGQDDKGEPLSKDCTVCHNDKIAPDMFTDWKASGHAEIFTQNINNPAGHWGINCASCHTVGYTPGVNNGGFDEAVAAEGWKVPPHGEVGLWTEILKDYPKTAKLANIQCENCHGPNNDSTLHSNGKIDAARVSISSDVCGACHGEPPRHGRFQQWEESGHGKYDLAIERFDNASCARCHVGQGFLAWLPQLMSGDSGNLKAKVTWTADEAEPVTCVVCHDPHNVGTVSGEPNDAHLRVTGDTAMLPSGFKVSGAGNGALCMTCHNTRNGEHNDIATKTQDDRAPHTAAQTDVLMGENAFFVTTGARSSHGYLEDTCVTCHMNIQNPPKEFSNNFAGTNHAFNASLEVCSSCHGAYNGGTIEEATHAALEELKHAIETAIMAEIKAQIAAGNSLTLVKLGDGGADVTITDASTITSLEFLESHGRQAMEIVVGGKTYDVRLASDTKVGSGTLISSAAGQKIAKAGWNYFLIEGDGSGGIHNPSYTRDVINAAIEALK